MRECLEDALNYETETLKELLLDLDQRIDRNRYLISSAEAKIQRVDPGTAEFEETVDLIESTKKWIQSLAHDRTVLDLELKRRTYIDM